MYSNQHIWESSFNYEAHKENNKLDEMRESIYVTSFFLLNLF